jgi:hypothetical protein
MRKFAEELPIITIVQQAAAQLTNSVNPAFDQFVQHPAAQIPWSHQMLLLDKLSDATGRLFYYHKIIENGWFRSVLMNQLERKLHLQQGALTHIFPPPYLSHNRNWQETLSRTLTFLIFSTWEMKRRKKM